MQERKITIRNKAGIHCRPSSAIMQFASKYPDHELLIESARGTSNMKSILDLLSLGLQKGDCAVIKVSGESETEVCNKLAELFETEFDFI